MDLRSPILSNHRFDEGPHRGDSSESRRGAADTTAPWPPLPPEDPSSFRWLQPGELLAIPVPTSALQLDALLRHLEIDGEFGDWQSATLHLAQARATWLRLEPALSTRSSKNSTRPYLKGTRTAARAMSKQLDAAAEAVRLGAGPAVVRHARAAIAQIEILERVFE
jgi:hypothetical protein